MLHPDEKTFLYCDKLKRTGDDQISDIRIKNHRDFSCSLTSEECVARKVNLFEPVGEEYQVYFSSGLALRCPNYCNQGKTREETIKAIKEQKKEELRTQIKCLTEQLKDSN